MPDGAMAMFLNWQPPEERERQQAQAASEAAAVTSPEQAVESSPRKGSARKQGSPRPKGSPRKAGTPATGTPRSVPLSARLYSPPLSEPRRAVCLKETLILRAGAALSSEKVGHLEANQMVVVTQQAELENGTVRARVGKLSSPRGVAIHPLGWVTMDAADEGTGSSTYLRILGPDEQHDTDWRRAAEKRRERHDHDRASSRQDSMAARIAQRRRDNIIDRKWLTYAQQADLIMPELLQERRSARGLGASNGRLELGSSHSAGRDVRGAAGSDGATPSGGVAGNKRGGAAGGAAGGSSLAYYAGPPEAHEAWMDPAVLRRLSAEHYETSRAAEARSFEALPARVGLLMHMLDVDAPMIGDLVSAADLSGDRLDKPEFRAVMRALGRLVPAGGSAEAQLVASAWLAGEEVGGRRGCTDRELDANFTTLDTDKSGSLDAAELSRYLLGLKAAITRKAYEKPLNAIVGLRSTAQTFARAAALVTDLEASAENGSSGGEQGTSASRSLPARLGIHLSQAGVKRESTDDMKAMFPDGDGNGKIVRSEFGDALAALGFEATAEEVGQLFDDFDADSNGSLALKELLGKMGDLASQAAQQLAAEAASAGAEAKLRAEAEHAMREALKMARTHATAR